MPCSAELGALRCLSLWGRHEGAGRLAQALTALPENQCEAIVLRHWHSCSLVEMGEPLGCTTAGVTRLLQCGLRNLRKRLNDLE